MKFAAVFPIYVSFVIMIIISIIAHVFFYSFAEILQRNGFNQTGSPTDFKTGLIQNPTFKVYVYLPILSYSSLKYLRKNIAVIKDMRRHL